ncbi:MAG: trehalose synthase/alpha amylase protein [Candidatus Kaiserbacteria bacterium]|nr:trehalose synthase/alpha amylase protein [Candidatus Kaiserbacteria bacterium]
MEDAPKKKYWWKDAKIYELYIDKFAGDIRGLTANLDYFSTLGVNTLHLLPHYPSPMVDDGYDITDYRGVRESLGTMDDFMQLITEAHARKIRIIVDFVSNHTSDKHPWFEKARSAKSNPWRDFYLWSETGTEFAGASNGMPDIKQSNWIWNEATHDYYYATYYPEQPDLNWDYPAVFEEMIAVMKYWAEIGVDGFRLDAVPHLIKRQGTTCRGLPETHALIRRIRARLEEGYPEAILIAEAHDDFSQTKAYFGNGDECHMAYHFILMEQLWHAIYRNDQKHLADIIKESLDIPENCQWAIFLRNHDEIALSSMDEEEHKALMDFLDLKREYGFRGGERTSVRLGSIFKGDKTKIMNALSLLYSMPGAPIMYYGDELGMNNLAVDPAIRDSRKYVRGAFDWAHAKKQIEDPESLFSAVSKLLRTSNAQIVHADEEDTVAHTA